MKEFAFGTEEQYNWLENLISDGQCHVFNNCVLPSSCTPDHARLGFDKLESVYAVYIDHGVTTTAEDPNFARFLQDGETKFMSMEDMSEFFHSLQPLFNTDASASSVCTEKQKENSETEAVDIQSLVAERSQRDKPKLLSPDAISSPIKQKVFGQDEAIESLAELIVLNRMRKKSNLLLPVSLKQQNLLQRFFQMLLARNMALLSWRVMNSLENTRYTVSLVLLPVMWGMVSLQHLMLFARTVITVLSSMKWRRQILS